MQIPTCRGRGSEEREILSYQLAASFPGKGRGGTVETVFSPNPPMRSGLGVGTRGEGRGTRRSALDSDKWGRWRPLVGVGGADGPGQRRWGGVGGTACQSRTGPVRLVGSLVASGAVGAVRQAMAGLATSQGASELGFPRPALWQMQSEAAGRAGEPSGQGEEAPPEGPGGHPLADGLHLNGQPGARGSGPRGNGGRRPSRMAFSISAWGVVGLQRFPRPGR